MEAGRFILYQSLKAIFLHIDNHEKALFSKYDLSVARFYALMHLDNNPGINYIDLSDLMLCNKSNTTRVVRSMQADGLVRRQTHPDDGRSYQLYLTDKGKSLYRQVHPDYLKQIDGLMSSFKQTELEVYTEASQHIERLLAPAVSSAGGKMHVVSTN